MGVWGRVKWYGDEKGNTEKGYGEYVYRGCERKGEGEGEMERERVKRKGKIGCVWGLKGKER